MRVHRSMGAVLALLLVSFSGAEGQAVDTVRVGGRVSDAANGQPVPGAVVRHLGTGWVAVSDSLGRFGFDLPRRPSYPIEVEQLGYASLRTFVPDTMRVGTQVRLSPRPVELQGLEVRVRGALAERRRFAGVESRVLETIDILELGIDGSQALRNAIPISKMCVSDDGAMCIPGRRNSKVPVTICLDEQPAYGGVDDLTRYRPEEIQSIEIYGRGGMVRVYTRDFVRQMLRERRVLRPLVFGC